MCEREGQPGGHGHVGAVPADQAGPAPGQEEGAGNADCGEYCQAEGGRGSQDEGEGQTHAGTVHNNGIRLRSTVGGWMTEWLGMEMGC